MPALPVPDEADFEVIRAELRKLQQQFRLAYSDDDYKLIADTEMSDQTSHLLGLTAKERRSLRVTIDDRLEFRKQRKKRRFQGRSDELNEHHVPGEDISEDPNERMMVDPSEHRRIQDLVHAKLHLDDAIRTFEKAAFTVNTTVRGNLLHAMLDHLIALDRELGYVETDSESGAKRMRGPVIEYQMDGEVIARALSTISIALNERCGIDNQLANDLRDDPLLGQYSR